MRVDPDQGMCDIDPARRVRSGGAEFQGPRMILCSAAGTLTRGLFTDSLAKER